MPPIRTVISGAVSVSSCARSTSSSSADPCVSLAQVVAEPVRGRLEHGERVARRSAPATRPCAPARREPSRRGRPSSPLPRRLRSRRERSGRRARPSFPPDCAPLKSFWICLQLRKHLCQFGRLVDLPILLRREANARAVRPTALVGAAERRTPTPRPSRPVGRWTVPMRGSWPSEQQCPAPRSIRDPLRERGPATAAAPLGTSGPRYRERGPMSRCVSLYHALANASANSSGCSWKRFEILRVDRVHPQREVRREHHRGVLLRRIVSIRHGARCRCVLGRPLVRAGGALRQLPLVAEQVVEEVVVPLGRVGGPCAFQARW